MHARAVEIAVYIMTLFLQLKKLIILTRWFPNTAAAFRACALKLPCATPVLNLQSVGLVLQYGQHTYEREFVPRGYSARRQLWLVVQR